MSLAAVAIATRNHLQTTFSLDANSCEIGFDGQPKPSCGELYIAIHPMAWTGLNGDWDSGEEYQFGVTLTMRMGFAPRDRWGIAVWLGTTSALPNTINEDGLDARVRLVKRSIHHNQYQIRRAASLLIHPTRDDMITTPLQLIRVEMPKPRDHNWFNAEPPSDNGKRPECGVSQTLVFGKCSRTQDIPSMVDDD